MKRYIALLRGINVSGQKKIQMAGLRQVLLQGGFTNVSTYIQSGNVVFDAAETTTSQATAHMGAALREAYGYDVKVLVLERESLGQALDQNPYIDVPGHDPKRIYFVFLFDDPPPQQLERLQAQDFSPEAFVYKPGCIHLYAANGMGATKLNNNFFEQKLRIDATTRNLNTVVKLLDMSA